MSHWWDDLDAPEREGGGALVVRINLPDGTRLEMDCAPGAGQAVGAGQVVMSQRRVNVLWIGGDCSEPR